MLSRFSNGFNRASLKWKCGSSDCSTSKAVMISWMYSMARFDMVRSRWQAAFWEIVLNVWLDSTKIILTSIKWGPAIAHILNICSNGLELRKTRKVTSPTRCNNSDNGSESFFCFLARLGHQTFDPRFRLELLYNWSLDARHKLLMNWHSGGKLSRSAESENRLSAWCDNDDRILAESDWLSSDDVSLDTV